MEACYANLFEDLDFAPAVPGDFFVDEEEEATLPPSEANPTNTTNAVHSVLPQNTFDVDVNFTFDQATYWDPGALDSLFSDQDQYDGVDFLTEQLAFAQTPEQQGLLGSASRLNQQNDHPSQVLAEGFNHLDKFDNSDDIFKLESNGLCYTSEKPSPTFHHYDPADYDQSGHSAFQTHTPQGCSCSFNGLGASSSILNSTHASFYDPSSSSPIFGAELAGLPTSDSSVPSSSPSDAPTRKKLKRRQSKPYASAESETSSLPFSDPDLSVSPSNVGSNGLRYNSLEAATRAAEKRVPSNIDHDDWEQIEANPTQHILRVANAFDNVVVDAPRGTDLYGEDKKRWNKFQQDHLGKVRGKRDKDEAKIEQAAWFVFAGLIETHKSGYKDMDAPHHIKKCSEHLDDIVGVISDYAIFRWDLIRHQRLDELVNCTSHAVSRKLANFLGNNNKRKRDEENAREAAEAGREYKGVLGGKGRGAKAKK